MPRIAQITHTGRVFLDNGQELTGITDVSTRVNDMTDHLDILVRLRFSQEDIAHARSAYGPGVLPIPLGVEGDIRTENIPEHFTIHDYREEPTLTVGRVDRDFYAAEGTDGSGISMGGGGGGGGGPIRTGEQLGDEYMREVQRATWHARETDIMRQLEEQQQRQVLAGHNPELGQVDQDRFSGIADRIFAMTGELNNVTLNLTPDQIERVERDGVEVEQVYVDGVLAEA